MPSSRPLQPPYSVNNTVFCTYASCQLIFSTSSSLQFWKPPVLTGGFYLIPFLSLWVPTLSPRSHCHMTWGLHAWHWSNPRVSNSDLPPGSPTPLSPPSGLSLASSPRLLLVTVAVSQGLHPLLFFLTPTFHTAAQCCDLQSCQTGAPIT